MAVVFVVGNKGFKPVKKTFHSAGYDFALSENVKIFPFERKLCSTDIHCILPKETFGKLEMRSSLALEKGLVIGGGVIDSDYRGEIKILLINTSSDEIELNRGERIAQLIVHKIFNGSAEMIEFESEHEIKIIITDDQDKQEKRKGGFGSTN